MMETPIVWTREEIENWIEKEVKRVWKHGQISLAKLGDTPDRTSFTIDGLFECSEERAIELHEMFKNEHTRFLIERNIFGELSYSIYENTGERLLQKKEFEARQSFFRSKGGYTSLFFYANQDNTIISGWSSDFFWARSASYRMSRTKIGKPKAVFISAF
ncbi:hypothetical protein [Armatimonas sp.]|uniref:hypothetical protein n=1 Tax=Armatimonas sp. TaxID=1872638 RepID=UPI002869FEFD|nr:hypothetical protein [Armatimonas sp.]